MLRRFGIRLLILCLCLLPALSLCGCSSEEEHTAYYYTYFDTFSFFTAYTADDVSFAEYDRLTETELARWHRMLNFLDPADVQEAAETVSEVDTIAALNALAGSGPVHVSDDLYAFLQFGLDAWELSCHTVNIGLGAVTQLWKEELNSEHPQVPDANLLRDALRFTDLSQVVLDDQDRTVSLPQGMKLDCGAIAKGYVAGKIRDRLKEAGCETFLLSLGGNVLCEGRPPRTNGWTTGLRNPFYGETQNNSILEVLTIENASLVTSGDYERFFFADGIRYHHIIDPETAFPGTRYRSVTIECSDAALADLLSTALFLLPEERGTALVRELCPTGFRLIYVYADGSVHHS